MHCSSAPSFLICSIRPFFWSSQLTSGSQTFSSPCQTFSDIQIAQPGIASRIPAFTIELDIIFLINIEILGMILIFWFPPNNTADYNILQRGDIWGNHSPVRKLNREEYTLLLEAKYGRVYYWKLNREEWLNRGGRCPRVRDTQPRAVKYIGCCIEQLINVIIWHNALKLCTVRCKKSCNAPPLEWVHTTFQCHLLLHCTNRKFKYK